MMNIRDYFLINKTKNPNKIKILDLLGFEADIAIDTTEYRIENIEVSDNLDQQSFDELISNTDEIISTPIQSRMIQFAVNLHLHLRHHILNKKY